MHESDLFTIAGGHITCRQCQAHSKRTGQRCRAVALRGKRVCRFHGGCWTGPTTVEGRARCAAAKTLHGDQTRALREHERKIIAERRWLAEQHRRFRMIR